MAGTTSLEAVKRKIKSLQEQADSAEDRAERFQKELLLEKKTKEQVSMFSDHETRRHNIIFPPLVMRSRRGKAHIEIAGFLIQAGLCAPCCAM